MIETEKQGNRKSRDTLAICSVLVIMFAITTMLFYVEIGNLRNLNNELQDQKSKLQNQLNSLNITYRYYVSTHSRSNSEYDDYIADHQYTNSEYDDYVESHQYTNLEYEDYVANHLYANAEYEEACYSFYYFKPEGQKFGVYDLDAELFALSWSEPYQADVFDCSEMSACLEWHLENKGWHAKIYVGDSPFGSGRHAWVIVETSEGKYMPVESTTLKVVWWSDPNFDNYWEFDQKFETIHDALDYQESGFDWWELGFSPLDYD